MINLRSIWYGLRNLFWCRHDLIRTGLKKSEWHDTDSRMLHGMMRLLVEFIDHEKPMERIVWDDTEYHRHVRNEFLEIRDWWDNYETRCDEISEALDAWHDERFKGCGDNWLEWMNNHPESERSNNLSMLLHQMEEQLEQEEEQMLVRLVKIRKGLWT